MACEVCEHCSEPIGAGEKVVCEGYSYHKQCKKCFVCNENDLTDAEIFKGVIFCSKCSARLFHTNKDNSNKNKDKNPNKLHELMLNTTHETFREFGKTSILTSKTSVDRVEEKNKSKPIPLHPGSEIKYLRMKMGSEHTSILKKCDPDIKVSVEMKQLYRESLRSTLTNDQKLAPSRLPPKYIKYRKPSSNRLSDMRVAELGTSTEIANTALRKKSEDEAVVIKSMVPLKRTASSIMSGLNTNESGDGDDSMSSELDYSVSMKSHKKHWMDRRIRSIMKIPYTSFKRNILKQSSIVSTLMSVEHDPQSFLKKINSLFHEEITEHQRRGLKRLYSTINRRQSPHKLGWLRLMQKMDEQISCKHLKTSHSYRCMRAHVMRIAGPTKSQLAGFRAKLFRMLVPSPRPDIRCKSKHVTPSCPMVIDSRVS
ncbi:PREDICTED: uncharacterized protein LOC106107165 [Papilio polytes]|uniref:uncharacterized protein LOC106107165 n=1 Tax=Papilio polytes TaxID=76194 RepID=UPI0006768AFE|nr:PREDICTED: uncharacterized protein LOC106107165 [Papilio polytes]